MRVQQRPQPQVPGRHHIQLEAILRRRRERTDMDMFGRWL